MELQAFELRVLQLHHRQTEPPLQLTIFSNLRQEIPCSFSIYQLYTLAMAALYTGAPPQGGPGYSFKQTPTTVPSGERQHGFYPYALLTSLWLGIPRLTVVQVHGQWWFNTGHLGRRLHHPRRRHTFHFRLQHQHTICTQAVQDWRRGTREQGCADRTVSCRLCRRW